MFTRAHIAYFLLVLISIKSLLVPVVYLDFELRKDFIIQNLCENRLKPTLKCNGRCYLSKRLAKIAEEGAAQEAEQKGKNMKKLLEEVFDDRPRAVLVLEKIGHLLRTFPTEYVLYFSSSFVPSLLRPPQFYS